MNSSGEAGRGHGFKEWLTVQNLLAERLPGLPQTRRGLGGYFQRVRSSGRSELWQAKACDAASGNPTKAGPGEGTRYHYSCLPPEAIAAYEARYRPAQDGHVAGHLGTVLLNLASDGVLRGFILQRIAIQPGISANRIRDLCLERFGANVLVKAGGVSASVRMPPLSAFRELVQLLRQPENL